MFAITLAARSARTVALCLAQTGARSALRQSVQWRLRGADGTQRSGETKRAVLALHDLTPDTAYVFEAAAAAPCAFSCAFSTLPCAGLVDVAAFGATPDLPDTADAAQTNRAAFQAALAAVPKGGTLRVPAGRWVCAPLALKSDMVLHLDRGAVLFAPSDRQDWPILPARDAAGRMLGSWEGLPEACFAAPLHAIGACNVTISGQGTLDGGGDRGDWWHWPKETRDGARRPRGLHLIDCQNTQLIGFTIRNAPSWTIHPQGCTGLTAAALRIMAPHDSPNTDGFDPEMCENVDIVGVHFSVGDDCIAIKAGKRGPKGEADHLRPTRHVRVRHCLMERGHGGVVIGSEMSGGVSDVTVEDCDMIGTDRGLRMKSRRGRGGTVARIAMRRVVMDGVLTAFSANAHYFCDVDGHADWVQSRQPAPTNAGTPHLHDITIEDVELRNLSHAVAAFLGLPEAPIGPIRLTRVTVTSFDFDAQAADPIMADHLRPLRHAGVLGEHADVHSDTQIVEHNTLTDPAHRFTEPK
ncbi:Polygalacturonase [Aquimixticola soesokkakensis]|uniref:Polygalacturonase n=1 Tax=Aquimixticola soesokkakensis TaxID=1519096 RepID=A0A1Y5RSR7_9RHOB|nr:glycoside hydrolase family 28 protein [Aquimixticola soesokkakensis]SLN23535.1 Polygalacturonase [Aquimixticola soesokkakensis]